MKNRKLAIATLTLGILCAPMAVTTANASTDSVNNGSYSLDVSSSTSAPAPSLLDDIKAVAQSVNQAGAGQTMTIISLTASAIRAVGLVSSLALFFGF